MLEVPGSVTAQARPHNLVAHDQGYPQDRTNCAPHHL